MSQNTNVSALIKKASLINAVFKYSAIPLQMGMSAVLARLLTPEDFGIVAVVAVFSTFFSLLSDMGLGVGIIQNKTLSESDVNNIFSFTVYLGLILGAVFAVCAFPISLFYNEEKLVPICLILSSSVFVNTCCIIPRALILKNKKFVLNGVQGFVTAVAGSLFAIICALLGMKHYALVLQSVFIGLLSFIWLILYTKNKFILKPEFASLKKILKISIFQFSFNFINYFSRNLDSLLTGKFMGSAALGFYDKAYKLILLPLQNLSHVITPALHPILSDFQNDKKTVYDEYMKIINILSIIGVFITAVCFFNAREIILFLYGEQWTEAIPCLKWLSLTIWIQMITTTVGSIYQSLNSTKLQFITGIVTTVLICSFTIFGVLSKNIETLSVCIAIAFVIWGFIWFYSLIKHCFMFSLLKFFKQLSYYFYAIILLFACGFIINLSIDISNVFISLVVKSLILLAIYIIFLILTKRINIILNFIKKDSNE